MGYVDPQSLHNPALGLVPPATWGDAVNDNFAWLAEAHPRCRVWQDSVQIVNPATWTSITWNQERFDVGGCHSTVTNPARLTVPAGGDGKYWISGHSRFNVASSGVWRLIRVWLNGTTIIAYGTNGTLGASVDTGYVSVDTLYALVAGDYVEMQLYHDAGGQVQTMDEDEAGFGFIWMAL